MFRRFQKLLPPLSATERVALQSGEKSIECDILRGKKASWLAQTHLPKISDNAQRVLKNQVAPLCESLNNYNTRQNGGLTKSQMDLCRPLFGLGIPPSEGGLGLNRHDQSQIVQTIASRSVDAGVTVMVPNSLGPAELIHHHGTDQQKTELLPKLATGDLIPCFGLTGTYSGSDAASMLDRGEVYLTPDGLRIKLDCEKRYITLAPVADLIGVAFVLTDPEGILPPEQTGITLALLPRDTPGLCIGQRHRPLSATFYNGPFQGKGIDIPVTSVVGGAEGLGQGWRMLMECLVEGRGISLPASALAGMKLSCLYAGHYTQLREQFRRPLAQMQAIQEHLAEMTYHTYTSTAAQHLYNALADQHNISSSLSAILKYSTTERVRTTVNHAMDVVGGIGICDGPGNLLAGIYGSLPVSITVEGSNTLTRSLMIYGQGLVRGHPYIQELQESLEEGDQPRFWKALGSTTWSGITSNLVSGVENILIPEGLINSQEFRIQRLHRKFCAAVNLGLPKAPGLKGDQLYSGAMADVMISLYEIQAVQWFYENRCREGLVDSYEADVVEYTLEKLLEAGNQALYRANKSLRSTVHSATASLVTLPWGTKPYQPSPEMTNRVADSLGYSTSIQELFSEGVDTSQPRLRQVTENWEKVRSGETVDQDTLYDILSVDVEDFKGL